MWILCARMNYCEVIFEFVLIYERLLGASCALYRRYKGRGDRYVEMRKDSSKFRTLYIRMFYHEFLINVGEKLVQSRLCTIIDISLLFIYFTHVILYAYLISYFIRVKCRKVVAVNL